MACSHGRSASSATGYPAYETPCSGLTALVRHVPTGNPRSPLVGPWPAFSAGARDTLVFDASTRVERAPRDPERAFWDGAV